MHPPRIRTLTTILNLYRRDGESARHPYSVLDGLYLGTYPSAPVHRKTFSMLQQKESPKFCTGSTITRPYMISPVNSAHSLHPITLEHLAQYWAKLVSLVKKVSAVQCDCSFWSCQRSELKILNLPTATSKVYLSIPSFHHRGLSKAIDTLPCTLGHIIAAGGHLLLL